MVRQFGGCASDANVGNSVKFCWHALACGYFKEGQVNAIVVNRPECEIQGWAHELGEPVLERLPFVAGRSCREGCACDAMIGVPNAPEHVSKGLVFQSCRV